MNGKCEDCRFWDSADSTKGLCRRYAPPPIRGALDRETPPWAEWCLTLSDDSCGDFQYSTKSLAEMEKK